MSRRRPKSVSASPPVARATEDARRSLLGDSEPAAAVLGEILRRVALALTAALIIARAYWIGEPRSEDESGTGLLWVLFLLCAATIGFAAMWLKGGLSLRRSWVDVAAIVLFTLVGLSAGADERRIAINRAWEWVGVGIGYVLIRTLPRSRKETLAIGGSLMLTAVALSSYGLYQIGVELPRNRAFFHANPRQALILSGIDPDGDRRMIASFKDRLFGSREPIATFALTNTLAGFLVGPAVIGLAMVLRGLLRPKDTSADRSDRAEGSILAPVLLFAAPLLVVITCLLLTKSRSAYLGLLVAMLIFGWRQRGKVSGKAIAVSAIGIAILVASLVGGLMMAGQLDRLVLTESAKSLTYRLQYWQSTWALIWDGPKTWWAGLGPGNFSGPYLKFKLPQSSEEISDPHNLFLEVWTTAGLPAMLALFAAIAWGLREALGPSREARTDEASGDQTPAPQRATWLVIFGGLGGWLLVVGLGRINPFGDGTDRWLVLGGSWGLAALLGWPFWSRRLPTADLFGLAALAITVNLLAAGGIGFAPVAEMLWLMLAISLNLREDRPCGVSRPFGYRAVAFLPLAVLAAMIGTFFGTVWPFWEAQSYIAQSEKLIDAGRLDRLDAVDDLYAKANAADVLASRGWITRARSHDGLLARSRTAWRRPDVATSPIRAHRGDDSAQEPPFAHRFAAPCSICT